MEYNAKENPRFRSMNGVIRSTSPDARVPRLTTTTARQLLNTLYVELCKHDQSEAEKICKFFNA